MRRRQAFNPRNYQRRTISLIPGKNNKDSLEPLFEKIRNMEIAKSTGEPISNNIVEIQKNFRSVTNTDPIPEKFKTNLSDISFEEENETVEEYIKNDKNLAGIQEYQAIIDSFLEMAENVQKQYQYCYNKIGENDKEVQDFLHELRTPKKNAEEGYIVYQIGHYIELRKQAYRNAMGLLKPINTFVAQNQETINKLKKTAEFLGTLSTIQRSQTYMQRSKLKLPVGDKFRSLTKQEQDVIRSNYEKSRKAGA